MTFQQLQYFLTVIEAGGFSAAAESLGISQPAMSKQMSQLEEELGFPLFQRSFQRYRNLRLTPEGERFRDCVLRCQDDLNRTITQMRRRVYGCNSEFRVGYVELWDSTLVFQTLRDSFAEKYPNTTLVIEAYSSEELIQALQKGEIDIATSYTDRFAPYSELMLEVLGTLPGGFIYSCADFPELGENPAPSDFDHIPLLYETSKDNPFLPELEDILEYNGIRCPRQLCSRYTAMIEKLFCGQGMALVSAWHSILHNKAFGFYSLGPVLSIGAAWMRGQNEERVRMCQAAVQALRLTL